MSQREKKTVTTLKKGWKKKQRQIKMSKILLPSLIRFSGIPSKVSLFMWNAFLDKILTIDNLKSKGWNLADRCVMCLQEEESMDHLFVHCAMGHMVWRFFLSHLNVLWSFPFHFRELISGWWIQDLDGLPSIIWFYLSGTICWSLWKEMNFRIFEGKSRNFEELTVQTHNTLLE